MEKNKQVITWSIVGVVVVVLLIVFFSKRSAPSVTPTPSPAPQAVAPTPTPVPPPTPAVKAPAASAAYTAALKKYADKRIQFEPSCQATPTNMTFKNPVTLMLDNRSPQMSKVVVAKVTYSIAPWDFKIITLSSTTLPQTDFINCNSSINVAQILLQK